MAYKEITPRFIINLFCGSTYCGNGYFETEDEAIKWFEADPFCDRAQIVDLKTNKKHTVKIAKM